MKKVAPWFYPKMCSEAPGLKEPFEAADYPYPIPITYDWQDADVTYAMTKAMFDLYPEYKDSAPGASGWGLDKQVRSEEHTSELQSLMRISYAVFCLKKKKKKHV